MVSTVVDIDPGARTADLVLPKGCYVCGNDVHLRLTPGRAHTWCPVCHLFSRPKLKLGDEGVTLEYAEVGTA